jgi:subtilisin family serine protease
MKFNLRLIGVLLALVSSNVGFSQEKEYLPDTTFIWYHADPNSSNYAGISLEQSYKFAQEKNLKSTEIVVAVIDSGVDTGHVDLKDNLWTNPNEIPNNGIDDDKNGYIDDIHGWNFPGNSNGFSVEGETLELTRLYRQYKAKFGNKTSKQIKPEDQVNYKEWIIVKKDFEQKRKDAITSYENLNAALKYYDKCVIILSDHLKNSNFTRDDVMNITTNKESLNNAKNFYLFPFGREMTRAQIASALEYYDGLANKKLNVLYDPRAKVGDNPRDINDSLIGNTNIYPEGSNHGTGVSGIIGAVRDNGIGLNGIAPNVKIMVIRVVPGGDEYDKDVALGIRYAVKMGARIINCSFGKDYSPEKNFVDDAVRFAAEKDVLIVHACGNDAVNIDIGPNFPTKYLSNPTETAPNWIEVAASNKQADDSLVAEFSNYGLEVDIFAPGVDIFSTAVKSSFDSSDGTSDAAPVVTGVAALVLSYYPNLSSAELKAIIIESGTDYSKVKVLRPSESSKRKKTKFAKLSSSGKVVNAFSALKLAYERKG